MRPFDVPATRAFTKFADTSRIKNPVRNVVRVSEGTRRFQKSAKIKQKSTGAFMPASGELIRSMNYVEDITTTLRRICISIPPMTTEERKRLAESLRTAVGAINAAIADLDKAGPQ